MLPNRLKYEYQYSLINVYNSAYKMQMVSKSFFALKILKILEDFSLLTILNFKE